MTIKTKIYFAGAITFMVLIILSAMNIWNHQQVQTNLQLRDRINEKYSEIKAYSSWKAKYVRTISEMVALGQVPPSIHEYFNPPETSQDIETRELVSTGRTLAELIRRKEQRAGQIKAGYEGYRRQITTIYYKLDRKIATILAKDQIAKVLDQSPKEQDSLAPYVLKSLNQLTLVALTTLITKEYSDKESGVITKNRQFLNSQLHLIDENGSVRALFKDLFLSIDSLDGFIKQSKASIKIIDSDIDEAYIDFRQAEKTTRIESILAPTLTDVEMVTRSLEKASRRALVVTILLLFIFPAITIGVGILGLRKIIIEPIASLVDAMKQVESGDFDISVPSRSNDEIGVLATAFSTMAEEIKAKVTELSQLNKSLAESEQKYRSLVENLPQNIFLKDRNSVFVSCNQNLADDFGIHENEITGKTDFDFFPRQLAEKYRQDDERIMNTGISEELEDSYIVDNHPMTVKIIKTPVSNEAGDITGILGIFWDISDRIKSEQALRKARNYISSVIDSMPSAIIGVDEKETITQWNSKAQQTKGLKPEEAIGKSLADIFTEGAPEIFWVREALEKGEIRTESKRTRHENEKTIYEDITIYPLIAGSVEGAVLRIDDVSEKVQMEEMMIQSEKMLSVGGLAAGMAHEINNPLAAIMQTAAVVSDRLKADNRIAANQKAAEKAGITLDAIEHYMEERAIPKMLNSILESGKRLSQIVNNTLSFARKSESIVSSYALEDLLDKTLELATTDYDLKKQHDFKLIRIVKEYREEQTLVPCESAKIQQVLLNILRNGAQAMFMSQTESPRFTIRTKLDPNRKMGIIEIEDNGPGMNDTTAKRIFEPFYTTKPIGMGTGLGLSVSYFIIAENHKGELIVESSPGSGAKFTISLPTDLKA